MKRVSKADGVIVFECINCGGAKHSELLVLDPKITKDDVLEVIGRMIVGDTFIKRMKKYRSMDNKKAITLVAICAVIVGVIITTTV